jgi:hypothetical protein
MTLFDINPKHIIDPNDPFTKQGGFLGLGKTKEEPAPEPSMEEILQDILNYYTGEQDLDKALSDHYQTGPLGRLELINDMEDSSGVQLDPSELEAATFSTATPRDMLNYFIAREQAESQTKAAAQVDFAERETRPVRSLVERMVYGKAQGADQESADKIERMVTLMALANPKELQNIRAFVGRPSQSGMINQLADTQDMDSFITDIDGTRDLISQYIANMTDTGLEQFPSAYFPIGDMTVLPEASPGVAMHELGHALDTNRERAFAEKLRRDLMIRFKPTLMQEHSAWSRGAKSLGHGAAISGKKTDEELAREALRDAYFRKRPALGTYWGAALGSLGGGLGGLLLGEHLAGGSYDSPWQPALAALLGSALGGSAGILGGAGIGNLITTEKGADRYAERYVRKGRKRKEKQDKKQDRNN